MESKFVALIPAFEPDAVLLEVLAQLKERGMEIVVVDDGSKAAFAEIFTRASAFAKVITHMVNKGKGAALKTGMREIQENYGQDCVIVTVDADGQHRAEDALRLCHMAMQHPTALILGSRRLERNVPLRSQFGNTITRLVYRLSTGIKVHDTQTGLRAFGASLVPKLLSIPGERYEYEMNVLLEFAKEKIPILETEIDTIYIDHNVASHFDVWKDSARIYKEILKFSASSFISFLVDYILYSLLIFANVNFRIANIGARIISATVNYILNRKYVFQSKSSITKSASQYVLLAAAILFFNTVLLELLVDYGGINQMLAKICCELICFLLSWGIQRCLIFRRKKTIAQEGR